MISIRKHFLISGLMMAALVPFPVLAQNAGTVNAANGGATPGAPAASAATQGNAAGTNSSGGAAAANHSPNKAGHPTGANTAANTAGTKDNAGASSTTGNTAVTTGNAAGANTAANTVGTKGNAARVAANQTAETPRPGDIRIIPAQQLINRPLVDPDGHDAGRINRVVLNTANGAIDFVIVAGNGNFNLQGKVLALPWRAIVAPIPANGAIKISVPAAKLLNAPLLNPGAVASLENPMTRAGVYGWYGYRYAPYGVGYGYGPYCCYGHGYGWAPGVLGGRYAYPGGTGNVYAGAANRRYDNYIGGNAGYGTYNRGNQNSPHSYQGASPNINNRVMNNGGMNNRGMNNAGMNGAGVANGGANANAGGNGISGRQVAVNAANNAKSNVAAGRVGPQGQQMVRHGLVIGSSGVVATLASPNTTSASALKADAVYAPDGHYIGSVQHVLLDPKRGEVAFALIKEGGFLGLAPYWFAIPVQAMTWTPYQGGYRLMVTARRLATEPSIPVQTRLPTEVSQEQLAQLYEHFGLRPYWQGRAGQNAQGMANARAGFGGYENHQLPIAR